MKNIKFLLLFTAILSIIFASGCKKDDNPGQGQNAPKFKSKTVTVPDAMQQSNNAGAQMAMSYINMMNGISSYENMMQPPGKTTPVHFKDGENTYTWVVNDNSGSYTVKMIVSETAEKIVWDMYITGNMDGHNLTDFLFIHAYQKKDESGSDFLVYDIETGNEYMDISWNVLGDGSTEYNFVVFQEISLKLIINTDGSGSLEAKEWVNGAFVLTYHATWGASGHGEYWEYDNGEEIDHGTW